MNIKSINNANSGIYSVNTTNLKSKYNQDADKSTVQNKSKTDKLELSEEAKKIQDIRLRVQNGFYDNPEVLREVAIKLDRDIMQSK